MTAVRTKEERPKEYSIPSLEKNGELALFYNLAYNRISKFIATKNNFEGGWELRDLFFVKNNNQTRTDFDGSKITENLFYESTYADLKLYVFKESQGPRIRWVSPADIKIMNLILLQLLRLRDYFSHFYHDDFSLWVCQDLKSYIDHKFKVVKEGYQPKYAEIPSEHFDIFEIGTQKLNNNGFNFFLSFFLTRGQMEAFLGNRQYFKEKGIKVNHKSGQIKDYDFARYLVTYYTLSDSHQLNTLGLEKNNISHFDQSKYLSFQINNYLHTVPEKIYEMAHWDLKKGKRHERDFVPLVQRRSNNFLPLAVRFMASQASPTIAWQVSQKIEIEKDVERDEAVIDDESAVVPNKYFDYVYEYTDTISPSQNPVLHDNNIRIEVKLNDSQFVRLLLSKEAFVSWCSARLYKKENEWVKALDNFLKGYTHWIDYLYEPNPDFKPEQYPLFNQFLAYKKSNGEGVLPKPLLELYEQQQRTETEAKQQLSQALEAKFERILARLNNEFASYLSLSTKLKTIDKEMVMKQNSFKSKKTSKEARLEVVKFNEDTKNRKNIRYEKQRLIHACLRLLFGRRARFPRREDKNNFDRFCYLLDLPRQNERNSLIINWLDKLRTKTTATKRATDKVPFNERFEKILTEDATSFDKLFEKVLALTREKIEFEKANLPTNQEWKNLFGLAKKYSVPYLTLQKSYEAATDLKLLLEPYRTEKEGMKYYYLGLPFRFFLKNGLSATTQKAIYEPLKNHPAYTQTKNRWQNYVSDHAIFAKFDTIKDKATKQAANGLHLSLIEDVLLNLIYGKINSDEWKFKAKSKYIKESSLDATFPLMLGRFKIFVSMREMYKNDSFIEGNRITKIAEILNKRDKEVNFGLEDIKKELKNQQTASRNFISELLKAEQKLAQNRDQDMNLISANFDKSKQYKADLQRVRFEEIPLLSDFVKYRNIALHGDILTDKTYQDLIIELKKCLEESKK